MKKAPKDSEMILIQVMIMLIQLNKRLTNRIPICLPGARLIAYSRFLSLLKYARRRLVKILKSLGCLQLKQRAPAALIGMHTTSQKHLAPSPFTIEA